MIRVKIKPERENFKQPIKGTEESACYDLYCSKIEKKGYLTICYLGFSTEIPRGWKGVISARSNLTKYDWVLANGIGIIDSDFRHEWQARFRQLGEEMFPYEVGDRVCQVSFEKVNEVEFDLVESTLESRREGGFGSTKLK